MSPRSAGVALLYLRCTSAVGSRSAPPRASGPNPELPIPPVSESFQNAEIPASRGFAGRLRARGRALADLATARSGLLIVLLGAVMCAAFLAAQVLRPKPGGRVVVGDATHHFVQLRSGVFDRDLDFRNEYVRIYGLRGGEPGTEWVSSELTVTGHVRNYMPVGPALLWAPLYLLLTAGLMGRAALGFGAWPDGFERLLQLAPGISGVAAATAGVWLSWRLARRYADPSSASIATFALWLGSPAIYYTLISPAYSHAASMFAASAFWLAWVSTREAPTIGRFALWGALAGLTSLMRWQDAVLLAVPLIEAIRQAAPVRQRIVSLAAAGLAWVVVFSPQMVVWHVLYGQPLAVPQGPSFLQWDNPHPVAVLFSDNHGLFTWTPLVLIAVIGLAQFVRRQRALLLPMAAVVLTSWYVNAAVADWWAGEAFGARRFLSLFPLFALGLATWVQGPARRTARLAVVGVLVGANLLLLLQYQLFMKGLSEIAPYPRNWRDMWLTRFVVPFRLLEWLWSR